MTSHFCEQVRKIEDYLLIRKIKAGDPEAWEKLVRKYYQIIFAFCVRRFFGDRLLAADLTQDIFLKLIETIDRYQYTGKFFNYLFTIAVNTCNNYQAKKKFVQNELNDQLQLQPDTTEKMIIESETRDQLQDVLDTLPDMQKNALILKYFYDLKVKDIAKIMDASVPTTQSRITQGLTKLREKMNREDFSDE